MNRETWRRACNGQNRMDPQLHGNRDVIKKMDPQLHGNRDVIKKMDPELRG